MTRDDSADPKELAARLTAFGRHLDGLLTQIRPAEAAAARDYFAAVPSGDPLAVWEWVTVLAGWPRWQPHALERRLALPPAADLDRLAAACRAAAGPSEQTGRRWLPLTKHPPPTSQILLEAADLIDAVRNPDPGIAHRLADLVPRAKEIDHLIEALPAEWAPGRVAALVTRLKTARPGTPDPLTLPQGPWTPAFGPELPKRPRDPQAASRWADWFRGAGADWFHDLATLAQMSPDVGPWLDAVCPAAGVRCYPAVNCRTGELSWPAGPPLLQPGLMFAEGNPPGAVTAAERFAAAPEAARFTVLVGDDPAGPLAAARAAWQQAADAALPLVRAALAGAVEDAFRTPGPPPAASVLAVLDELARAEASAPGVEQTLAAVRAWAAVGGWAVVPAGPALAGEDLILKTVFKRDTVPGAVVRLKSYGLRGPDGLVRSGEVVVSAGPPPHGLTDLEATAAGAPGEAGEALRTALRGLRAAGAGGYLEMAAVDLYTLFWDQVQPAWAEAGAPPAAAFADDLAAMMREAFNLHEFRPTHYRDHPADWVQVPPGTRMTTGRVTRVLRPGLTSNGELRLPARVEAE